MLLSRKDILNCRPLETMTECTWAWLMHRTALAILATLETGQEASYAVDTLTNIHQLEWLSSDRQIGSDQ